jgi:hypothetical protein
MSETDARRLAKLRDEALREEFLIRRDERALLDGERRMEEEDAELGRRVDRAKQTIEDQRRREPRW